MPELSEVEAWRALAERETAGHTISQVYAAQDDIVFDGVAPRTFVRRLKTRRVVAAHRRGKQLWLELDRRPWPLFHFGMTGSFHVYRDPTERPRFCKAEITFEDGRRLGFRNIRRLGRIRLQQDPLTESPIKDLGFDPYLELPAKAEFREIVLRRKTPIKALLLNQSVFAGVGNWIADEVLYQAGIRPTRLACDLSPKATEALRTSLRMVLRKAIAVDADSSRFPKDWLFHVRWGKANASTRLGEPMRYDTVGGRTTAWVPSVQK